VFASGSPQPSVQLGDTTYPVSQANNMYIFPGLARGAYLGRTGVVTDAMLMVAAETLPALVEEKDVGAGLVYPQLQVHTHSSDTVMAYRCRHVHGQFITHVPDASYGACCMVSTGVALSRGQAWLALWPVTVRSRRVHMWVWLLDKCHSGQQLHRVRYILDPEHATMAMAFQVLLY
jgi:hypothetical protein